MPVHPSTLLVIQMANLATKREAMLNFLVVVPQPPSTVASDDDFFAESDVVEFRPRKRTHINIKAPGNSDGRPLVRRHSPTENWRSTGPRQQSRTQVDLHKRVRMGLACLQPRSLEDTSPPEPQTLSDSASATSEGKPPHKFWKREFIPPENILTIDLGDGPRTSWFTVDKIVKLMRSYCFTNERSLACTHYKQQYFSPLCWPTVLLVCTALRCSLMDYEDTGHKSLAVADFSQAVFDYYKRYYQTYQKKIEKRMQKMRSQHETERIETTAYEDDKGDDVRDLIESDENA
ncbi:hypothetical protein HOY80DRAFT_1048520 [Tuber brumale]|nr:hypothetical protein HOY80DRAFT_1048520 [Tuber brumale]